MYFAGNTHLWIPTSQKKALSRLADLPKKGRRGQRTSEAGTTWMKSTSWDWESRNERSQGNFHVFSYEMRSVEGNPRSLKNQRVGLKLVLQILDTEHQLCLDLIRHLCWLPWGTLQKRSILVVRVRKAMERQSAKKESHRVGATQKKTTPLLTTWFNHIWIHEL